LRSSSRWCIRTTVPVSSSVAIGPLPHPGAPLRDEFRVIWAVRNRALGVRPGQPPATTWAPSVDDGRLRRHHAPQKTELALQRKRILLPANLETTAGMTFTTRRGAASNY
jgi:hypothetical protein